MIGRPVTERDLDDRIADKARTAEAAPIPQPTEPLRCNAPARMPGRMPRMWDVEREMWAVRLYIAVFFAVIGASSLLARCSP